MVRSEFVVENADCADWGALARAMASHVHYPTDRTETVA
jgi:hypothetical protein